jgi:hypothetical protein
MRKPGASCYLKPRVKVYGGKYVRFITRNWIILRFTGTGLIHGSAKNLYSGQRPDETITTVVNWLLRPGVEVFSNSRRFSFTVGTYLWNRWR